MGSYCSTANNIKSHFYEVVDKSKFNKIYDNYDSLADLSNALRVNGLEKCQLILGIDYTASNTQSGGHPVYKHRNLHTLSNDINDKNPYEQVISIIGETLINFDDDELIDVYGFGCSKTSDTSVFSLGCDYSSIPYSSNISREYYDFNHRIKDVPIHKLDSVIHRYRQITPYVKLSGPTSFAPIINRAVELVKERNEYHILLIISDGCVTNVKSTHQAIVNASKYPLSIICVGVGIGDGNDGWKKMEQMDDDIPDRDFDNFQFVDFHKIMNKSENPQIDFAKHALMEIPQQYEYITKYIMYNMKKG